MRSSAAFGIDPLKHQQSLLPWLMPHVFGAPQAGQMLGSTAVSISLGPRLAPFLGLGARSEQRFVVVVSEQAAVIVGFGHAGEQLAACNVRDDVTRGGGRDGFLRAR